MGTQALEIRLGIGLAIGLVIGAERERHKGTGAKRDAAGIRTFAVVALLGSVVAAMNSVPLLAVVGAFVGSAALAAYVLGDRTDPGLTTEASLVLTYCLGALAISEPRAALAAGVSTAAVLAFRNRLHTAARNLLSDDELNDALLFGVAAIAVLPLLPNTAIDPLGVINPFVLWRLVVLLMAMSSLGYVAQRIVGPRYGLALAGFAAGFVSSSAHISAMGARAKGNPTLMRPAIAGAAASNVATFVQLATLIGAASPSLLEKLAWPLSVGAAAAATFAAIETWFARRAESDSDNGRAFKLSTALVFVGIVAVVSLMSALAQRWFGGTGVMVAGAIAGLADAHGAAAAIASVSASNQLSVGDAEYGIVLALTTNTATKMILAVASGPRTYAVHVIVGLTLMLAATWAALLLSLP